MRIREFRTPDTPVIQQLFYDTVRQVNCRDYNPEQIATWSASALNDEFWQTRLQTRHTYVAEIADQIVGFAMLDRSGYIDCFYCHHLYQGQGVGSGLLNHIEAVARSWQLPRLWAEASITAQPFFHRRGYKTIREQQVERRGIWFVNFVVEKELTAD